MIAESFAVVWADAAGETVAPGKLKFAQEVVGALLHDEIAERLGDV